MRVFVEVYVSASVPMWYLGVCVCVGLCERRDMAETKEKLVNRCVCVLLLS